MKGFLVAALACAGALGLAASAANAATFVDTFQGATFTVTTVSDTEFTFDISGANALTGDWTGATYLGAFAFGDNLSGTPTTLTAVLTDPSTDQSTSYSAGGLDSGGCNGSGAFYCFNLSPNVAVASDLTFDITVTGATFNYSNPFPDLKIDWTTSSSDDTHLGSLYSATIPPAPGVPEPAAWATMLVGIGAIGAALRFSRRRAAGLAAV